ncbi:peroxidase 65 [Musa troglodytarum]|uniref:peroxidase n=1 Tax=Musa troglodytarum TaxID=320322 RepID=A0A9E7HY79_9LILI|nr:peroxidase 65 [Musa troglodytarum]
MASHLLRQPRWVLVAAAPALLFLSLVVPFSAAKLTTGYYRKSCPRVEQIVSDVVTNKQISSPTTAAGALRLFFHDCFVGGCDASVLISTNAFNRAERDADINLSLPGDAFDAVVRAKTALELQCPGTVSCADILALATRDLVSMLGGPFYAVPLGRKALQKACAKYVEDDTIATFNDVMTPGKFDNMYYLNLKRGLGLLTSDHALVADRRTKPLVDLYAANQSAFFRDFSRAMLKLGLLGVKTGRQGEVRRRCHDFNNLFA